MENENLRFTHVCKIDPQGRVCLGSLIDGFDLASIYVSESDMSEGKIHVLPLNNGDDFCKDGLRKVDRKNRISIKKWIKRGAVRALIARDDQDELVIWPRYE